VLSVEGLYNAPRAYRPSAKVCGEEDWLLYAYLKRDPDFPLKFGCQSIHGSRYERDCREIDIVSARTLSAVQTALKRLSLIFMSLISPVALQAGQVFM
jgi:hypothetical protein